MTGNMEEDWKEKMWMSSRDRIAETYQRASSVDVEAFMKSYIMRPCSIMLQYIMTMLQNMMDMLNHARRNYEFRGNAIDMINHARRKYEFRGSPKHIKLGQIVTRLRMGRLGYLLLLFAALSTLAVPMMFQSILPQQVDQEFERAMTMRDHNERGESSNREANLSEEKHLILEEGNESLENKPQIITGGLNEKENMEDNLSSKAENTTGLTSEVVKLPDPVRSWSKPGQLERELSEMQHVASMKESDLSTSEERIDSHQRATRPKTSRPKRNKFKRLTITEGTVKHADEAKEDRGNLDPRAIDLSAEQVSLNVAPPGAHSVVDAVGSPNGFTEAYEEVLKLASEANKTTGEKSAQLQEESSMTELLSNDKPADLNVQAVEVIDVDHQKLSTENNESSVKKDTMTSVGLASEEHEHNISVGGDSDALREATHNTTQSDSSLSEIPILDPHGENDKSQNDNLLHTKENFPTNELETSAASTVSNAAKTVADVQAISSDLHQEVIGNSNESMITTPGQTVLGSDSEVRLDENGGEAGNSLETSSILGGGLTVNVTGTISNFTSMKDGDDVKFTNVTVIEKPDDGVVRDQLLQGEVQQENSNDQPQESGLISSLISRAASGSLQVGLLNMGAADLQYWQFLAGEEPMIIPFERVKESVKWNHLYPEWIDEEQRYGTPNCPSVPMPMVSPEVRLDVVIAYAPCTPSSALQDGWKNPTSLQVLLGAANLAVKTGNESAYVLILSECRPLVNLFKCGELLEHRDQGWLYQVNLEQLRKRISLPVGSCQLSVSLQGQDALSDMGALNSQRDAYATILHSGADYVCGAIATAHSIRKTSSTKDLVVLVDSSILPEHRQALQEAGWKVRSLERIYKSHAVGGIQQEKDFSRFRLWQLTDYSKVIYVEADVLVLRNLDHLFRMPEISGSGSTRTLFNSGLMVIEPSNCTFQYLMDEMEKTVSQVGGDWDFFNRIFPWWHRIPRHMNYLKYFWTRQNNEGDYMNKLFSSDPPQLYAIHYWGYKPWQCFRDYDCNWNINQQFASDEAHAQWFKVYDDMPENLQKHCGLSTGTKAYLELNRRKAEAATFPDKHWAVTITDPRLNVCQENHCDWNALLSHWDKTFNATSASMR